MVGFIEEEFSDFSVVETVEDGINETCRFESGGEVFVGKLFNSGLMDAENYLGSVEVVDGFIMDGRYVHTPDIISSGVFEGDAYVIYQFIEGDVLGFDELYESGGLESYLESVGGVMAELHSYGSPVDDFGWFTMREDGLCLKNGYERMAGLSLSQLEYTLGEIGESSVTDGYGERARRVFRENIDYGGEPVVCHCDVKFDNIVDSGAGLYLIDWEFIRSGDPLYDYVKAERSMVRRYDRLDMNGLEEYRGVFRDAYFGNSSISFDEERYWCYWVLEMLDCLNMCEEWYPDDEVEDVKEYYMVEIERYLQLLEG